MTELTTAFINTPWYSAREPLCRSRSSPCQSSSVVIRGTVKHVPLPQSPQPQSGRVIVWGGSMGDICCPRAPLCRSRSLPCQSSSIVIRGRVKLCDMSSKLRVTGRAFRITEAEMAKWRGPYGTSCLLYPHHTLVHLRTNSCCCRLILSDLSRCC